MASVPQGTTLSDGDRTTTGTSDAAQASSMSENGHQQPAANGSAEGGGEGGEGANQQSVQAASKAEKARREAKAGAGPGKGQSQAAPQQQGPLQVGTLCHMLLPMHLL